MSLKASLNEILGKTPLTEPEKRFFEIATADWNTQYLTSTAEVKKKCFCGRIIKAFKIHKADWVRKNYFDGDLETAKTSITTTLFTKSLVLRKETQLTGAQRAILLIAMALNVSQLNETINKKRGTLSPHHARKINGLNIVSHLSNHGNETESKEVFDQFIHLAKSATFTFQKTEVTFELGDAYITLKTKEKTE